MKNIDVSREELIETIAAMTDDFGSNSIKIFVGEDGGIDVGEAEPVDCHVILSLSGLGSFVDNNGFFPGTDSFDSVFVAKYIVNGGIINNFMEYDDGTESVQFSLVK